MSSISEPPGNPGKSAIVLEERLRIPSNIFELAKFRDWAHSAEFPDSGRFSYIGGEIEVEMSPEELETHNKVKGCVSAGVVNWVERRDTGEVLVDRALLVNEAADLATEPDLMYCSWESLRTGRVRYTERKKGSRRHVEVSGSPDLIVEAVSDSSERKDRALLPPRYFRAGVLEYWLIDARGDEIQFTIFRRGSAAYEEAGVDADGARRSALLGGSFRLVRGRNPVGGYAYRLLGREWPAA